MYKFAVTIPENMTVVPMQYSDSFATRYCEEAQSSLCNVLKKQGSTAKILKTTQQTRILPSSDQWVE